MSNVTETEVKIVTVGDLVVLLSALPAECQAYRVGAGWDSSTSIIESVIVNHKMGVVSLEAPSHDSLGCIDSDE